MRSVSIPRRNGQKSRAIAATLCLIFLFSAVTMGAQSGRKVPKRNEAPKPVQPSTEKEPVKAESEKPEKSLTPLLILKSNAFNTSPFLADIVMDGCAARLQKSSALKVNASRTETHRGEASDRAKASQDLYVLWMEPQLDRIDMNRNANYTDVSVEFYLFAPQTGDRKTWGRVFLRPYTPTAGPGGARVPLPVPSGRVPIEYLLRQAGEDMADRVLNALSLSVPQGQ